MADYGCYTWTDSDALFPYRSAALNDNLDLARLGATVELASALRAWHADWEQHAWGDLRFSAEAADAWERRGWTLARQLQDQLPDINIHVWDYDLSQVVDIPSETKKPVYGSRIS